MDHNVPLAILVEAVERVFPVALTTKRMPLYNHEYEVFGKDNGAALLAMHGERASQGEGIDWSDRPDDLAELAVK